MQNTKTPVKMDASQKRLAGQRKAAKILAVIFISFMVLLYFAFPVENSEEPDIPTESEAYRITTNFVEGRFGSMFNELDCPFADYQYDYLNDSSYLIVSHFTYKNDFGVEKKFNYKARVKWNGGKWANKNNWTLVYIEEYNQQ